MSPRPPRLGVGSRVGAWQILAASTSALHPDGKVRSRWWCRCACGHREAVFDRDLKPRGTDPPRRRSCGDPACKAAAALLPQIERMCEDVGELLKRETELDAARAEEIAAALAFEQRARVERELRASKNRRVVQGD